MGQKARAVAKIGEVVGRGLAPAVFCGIAMLSIVHISLGETDFGYFIAFLRTLCFFLLTNPFCCGKITLCMISCV